jgi:hypothetical protein
MTVRRREYRDGMARLGAAVKVGVKVGLRGRSGMLNVVSALPAYGMALLGVSLLTLPLFDGAVINFATAVPSVTAGSAIALLAVAQCVRPDYWQYLTEVLLGFAVTLTAIFTRPTLAQCDWQLLAMGVAVMILATISDGSTLKLIGMNIRQHGSMALKMHFLLWWRATRGAVRQFPPLLPV